MEVSIANLNLSDHFFACAYREFEIKVGISSKNSILHSGWLSARVLDYKHETSHDAITVLSPLSPDLPLFKQRMIAAKANPL